MSQEADLFLQIEAELFLQFEDIISLDLVTPSDGGGVAAGGIIAGGFDGCWLCGGRWELGNE